MEENRSVGWLCCAAGNLTVTAQTDRGGYCPGEAICVSAYINNQMKREVIAVELILDQRTVFISSQGKANTSGCTFLLKSTVLSSGSLVMSYHIYALFQSCL